MRLHLWFGAFDVVVLPPGQRTHKTVAGPGMASTATRLPSATAIDLVSWRGWFLRDKCFVRPNEHAPMVSMPQHIAGAFTVHALGMLDNAGMASDTTIPGTGCG